MTRSAAASSSSSSGLSLAWRGRPPSAAVAIALSLLLSPLLILGTTSFSAPTPHTPPALTSGAAAAAAAAAQAIGVARLAAVPRVPVTVLSGFLGSGKTSLLRDLLQNDQGLKIAVVVNDVASVNIDSRLVLGSIAATDEGGVPGGLEGDGGPAGLVQLSNGCACCSLSEELLASVSELITLSDMRGEGGRFDHIVVELSGVAEPRSVRSNFQDAEYYQMPLMDRVQLDTMVTVVDCTTFLDHLRNGRGVTPSDSPELFYRTDSDREEADRKSEEEMETLRDLPEKLRDALIAGNMLTDAATPNEAGADAVSDSGVSDLLVEQTEVADVILLNKVDILKAEGDGDVIDDVESVVKALNPRATIHRTEFGVVERLEDILGVAGGSGVADAGVVDDHRDFVDAAEGRGRFKVETEVDPVDAEVVRADPDSSDLSRSHSHSHDHRAAATATASDNPDCTDQTHSHSHEAEASSACDDPTHSHSHSHDHSCENPDCTDPTHNHAAGERKGAKYGGIGTYVYRARRPFHPVRLASFLGALPIKRGAPPTMTAEGGGEANTDSDISEGCRVALSRVLRSKGFSWLADSNRAAMYWSHAGSSFEMQCLGRWWATLPRDQWPEEAGEMILAEFDDVGHEEGRGSTVGDRRQEIVFIGPGLGGGAAAAGEISAALDSCLLSRQEWDVYCGAQDDGGDAKLREIFANPIESRVVQF